MLEEYEKFGAVIKRHPSGSHFVIIPISLIKFTDWKEGDEIILMGKKKEVKQDVD